MAKIKGTVVIERDRCKGCRVCVEACPMKVLDLAAFPLMDGAEDPGVRRMASLTYQVKADVKRAYDFQKAKLADRGWEERPGGHVSDEVATKVSFIFYSDAQDALVKALDE